MTKIPIDESALRFSLDAVRTAKLCVFNSMSSRREVIRLLDSVISRLNQALAEAALDKMADNARELGLDYMEGSAEQYERKLK